MERRVCNKDYMIVIFHIHINIYVYIKIDQKITLIYINKREIKAWRAHTSYS